MAAQYRSMNRGGKSIYELVRKEGYDPSEYIRFYHLRSYDRINAPLGTFISQMEQNSGVTFHEAQIALARMWIGEHVTGDDSTPKEVFVKVPQPTQEGFTVTNAPVKQERISLPPSYDAAKEIIERFQQGAQSIRGDDEVADSVAQHALRDTTNLKDEQWLGTEEEELNSYVSELTYIHSKLMIVDDRRVILGSANLNDRSQKGDGDSEIALVVEDNDMIRSSMNGEPFMAGRFAATLRRRLYREHLGLLPPQNVEGRHGRVTPYMRPAPEPQADDTRDEDDALVADPLADDTVNLWNRTARANREIFTELFRPIPTNLVTSWSAYEAYVPKVKTGHVVPDIPLERVKDRLSYVKGTLVECPMEFLIDEKEFVEGIDWIGLNPTLPIYI